MRTRRKNYQPNEKIKDADNLSPICSFSGKQFIPREDIFESTRRVLSMANQDLDPEEGNRRVLW